MRTSTKIRFAQGAHKKIRQLIDDIDDKKDYV